jgi:hypothetical protein
MKYVPWCGDLDECLESHRTIGWVGTIGLMEKQGMWE